jgi:hypothetical protein
VTDAEERSPGAGHEPRDEDAAHDDDAEALRGTSERVERLLADLRASVAPAAWARVQELVASLTTLYGEGLARTLRVFAGRGSIDGETREKLCDDAVIASLLLLHGLHPSPIEERVARAVRRMERSVGAAVSGGTVEIAVLDGPGSFEVRLCGDWRGSSLGGAGLEAALRRAVEEAAPDLEHLAITREGAFRVPPSSDRLVQIDLTRSRRGETSEVVR